MNTMDPVSSMDLYAEERRYADIEADPMRQLHKMIADAEQEDAEAQQYSATMGSKPVHKYEEAMRVQAGASSDPTEQSTFGKIMTGAEFVLSPLLALGDFVAAPIAHDYEEGEGVGTAIGIAGQAFMNRLLPTYGQETPFYGEEIAEKIVGEDAPQWVKTSVGFGVEVVTDPLTWFGPGLAKAVQQGFKRARAKHIITGQQEFRGVMQEGVDGVLRKAKGVSIKDKMDIRIIAKNVDEFGEHTELRKLNDKMESSPAIQEAARLMDDVDVDTTYDTMKSVFGDPDGPLVAMTKDVKGMNPKDLFRHTVLASDSIRGFKINLATMTDNKSVQTALVNMLDTFGKDFDTLAKAYPKEMLKPGAQTSQLSDFMGRQVHQFDSKTAYQLRQVLTSSAEQLVETARRAMAPAASRYDDLAFEQMLAIHRMIQKQTYGVASEAGKLLRSFSGKAPSKKMYVKQIQKLTDDLVKGEIC